MEALALCEKIVRETILQSRGRAELLEALQHHPGSPYRDEHDHPIEDHIAAVQRDMDEGSILIEDVLKSELTPGQREQVVAYAAQRRGCLESTVMPACQALRAGDYGRASRIIHGAVWPARMFLFTDGTAAEKDGAKHAIWALGALFGAAIALSFAVMALA